MNNHSNPISGPLGYHPQQRREKNTQNDIGKDISKELSPKKIFLFSFLGGIGLFLIAAVIFFGVVSGHSVDNAQSLKSLQQILIEEKLPVEPGDLKQAIVDLKKEHDAEGKKMEEQNTKLTNLEKQLKKLTTERDDATAKRDMEQRKVTDLLARLDKADAMIDDLQDKLDKEKAEVDDSKVRRSNNEQPRQQNQTKPANPPEGTSPSGYVVPRFSPMAPPMSPRLSPAQQQQ